MDKNDPAVNTPPAAAPETNVPLTLTPEEDAEARVAKLEVEVANWKEAALKYKTKAKSGESETEEERIERIVNEKMAATQISRLDDEKETILRKALKENKELKLAQLNKNPTPPAAMGTHTEGNTVTDTLVTPEQLAYFKAKKWSDKDIELYKKNLLRQTR